MDVLCCPGRVMVAVALAGTALVAQNRSLLPDARFRSGIDLVSVPATVIDEGGRPVTGLPVDAFDLFEDGDRQPITQFTNERVPISLAVLLDVSDSMFGRRLDDARGAVERFLFELLDPEDEFAVVSFNHDVHPLTGWTRAPDVVRKAFEPLRPWGATAIYDAVLSSLPLMAARSRPRAGVIIISDGADTASDATIRDVRTALLQSDAFVYAIAIDTPEAQAIAQRVSIETLNEITSQSGGRTEIVRATADIEQATANIADELNHQYVLGYSSPHPGDGQYHSIRVRATNPAYKVRARTGYVSTKRVSIE